MKELPEDETGNALRQIMLSGSDLSKPMEMDFFIAAPSGIAGNQIAKKVRHLGFEVSVEQDDETGDWTCYCTKTIIPDYSEVVSIEKILSDISQPYRGFVDGFGSYGNGGH